MAPKFGLDDGSSSNFDATLVLATMLISQLREGNSSEPPQGATTTHVQAVCGTGSQPQARCRANASEHPSDHTRIWSELSGNQSFMYLIICTKSYIIIYFVLMQEVQQEVVVVLMKDRLKDKET